MQESHRIPRYLIIPECIGGIFILLALVLINSSPGFIDSDSSRLLAKISLFLGIILILPAVVLLLWRTLQSVFPKLRGKK